MLRLTLILFLCPVLYAQTIDYDHQLLWEISGNGLKSKSYLFGTLHSNDRRLFNFTDSTYFALNETEALVLEADVFSLFEVLDTRKTAVRMKFDNKGRPFTTSTRSTKTDYGDEDGMPQFLDAYLQQYCYNANKKFIALETTESQVDLFTNIGLPDLSQMKLESFITSKEDMVDLYIAGDIYRMDDLLRMNLRVYPDLYDEMIVERNVQMSQKLDSLLKHESLFCAVGAGHLAGNSGLISLLRKKGYKLRKVVATYNEEELSFKDSVRKYNSYEYLIDSLGLHMEFPGKPAETTNEFGGTKLIYRDFGQGNTYVVEINQRTDDVGLEDLAVQLIASPSESGVKHIELDNGGEAYQGLADSYPEGVYWARVIMSEDVYVVIKSYGGNKFMNSNRAFQFFDKIWFE